MKKIAITAIIATTAFAVPAAAQSVSTTGTINIIGQVEAKCFVVPGAASTFETTVDMGELAGPDGMLLPTGTLASTFASQGGSAFSPKVLCTSATPQVSVRATPLSASSVTAAAGYDNSIDYTAVVTFRTVNGDQVVENATTDSAATSAALPSRLTTAGGNISVATKAWSASGVLVASDAYSGNITISVSPSA